MEVIPAIGHAYPSDEPKEPDKKGKFRPCPRCGQLRELKSPWQELWRMPTLNEWIMLFIIVMVLFMSWAYKRDIGICKDFANNIDTVCSQRGITIKQNYTNPLSNFTFDLNTLDLNNKNNNTNITNNTNIINTTNIINLTNTINPATRSLNISIVIEENTSLIDISQFNNSNSTNQT